MEKQYLTTAGLLNCLLAYFTTYTKDIFTFTTMEFLKPKAGSALFFHGPDLIKSWLYKLKEKHKIRFSLIGAEPLGVKLIVTI